MADGSSMDHGPTGTLLRIAETYGILDRRLPDYAGQVRRTLDAMDAVRPKLERAARIGGDTHDYDDLVALVLGHELACWIEGGSVMLTEVHQYPRKRHYHLFMCAGRLTDILPLQAPVCAAATALGCSRVTIAGRAGWLKPLTAQGWTAPFGIMALDVEAENG